MKIEYNGKWFPEVGEKVTLRRWEIGTANPYTVESVTKTEVIVRACGMKFSGPRYFDSLPTEIYDDEGGMKAILTWSPKRKNWVMKSWPKDNRPAVADFGVWDYEPYVD